MAQSLTHKDKPSTGGRKLYCGESLQQQAIPTMLIFKAAVFAHLHQVFILL
jgi:hypothetical protein